MSIPSCFQTRSNILSLSHRLWLKWSLLLSCAVMGMGSGSAVIGGEPLRIDTKTQLFVDDLLIHHKEGIVRRVQPATKMDKPVLTPEHPWEFSYHPEDDGVGKRIYVYGTVFFDSLQDRYRMWYMSRMSHRHDFAIPELEIPGGGNIHRDLTLYATSTDGIRWEKPDLGLCHFNRLTGSGENIVGDTQNNIMLDFHGASIFLDREEPDPQKRYKAIGFIRRFEEIRICYSPDGIHWSEPQPSADRRNEGSFNACYVPGLGRYVVGSIIRSNDPRYEFINHEGQRGRKRVVTTLISKGRDLERWEETMVIYPDDYDPPSTQFYGMAPFTYGDNGIIFGFLHVFDYIGPGSANDDGPIEAQLVYSRDGREWHRTEDRSPVIPLGPKGSIDGGMIIMTALGTSMHDDELVAYYTAGNTGHGAPVKNRHFTIARASWRRDRLVVLQADGERGIVETVPLETTGNRLEINADAMNGRIAVEVLDTDGNAQSGYSGAACDAINDDSLAHEVRWEGGDLSSIRRPFRLRFVMHNAKLYAFRIK